MAYENLSGACAFQASNSLIGSDSLLASKILELQNDQPDRIIHGLAEFQRAIGHVNNPQPNTLFNMTNCGNLLDFEASDTNRNCRPGSTSKAYLTSFFGRLMVNRRPVFLPIIGLGTSETYKCSCSRQLPAKEPTCLLSLNKCHTVQESLDKFLEGEKHKVTCNCGKSFRSKSFITSQLPRRLIFDISYRDWVDNVYEKLDVDVEVEINNADIYHNTHKSSSGSFYYSLHGFTKTIYIGTGLSKERHDEAEVVQTYTAKNDTITLLNTSNSTQRTVNYDLYDDCFEARGVNQLLYKLTS